MIHFREARRADVAQIVALLADDRLGATRELDDLAPYLAAFDRMRDEGGNRVIVGEEDGRILATYQITFISGLSLAAARRAQIESVRVARSERGRGIGRAMFADAEARARVAGCRLMQLTMNAAREESHAFYRSIGFEPTHVGFKRPLD